MGAGLTDSEVTVISPGIESGHEMWFFSSPFYQDCAFAQYPNRDQFEVFEFTNTGTCKYKLLMGIGANEKNALRIAIEIVNFVTTKDSSMYIQQNPLLAFTFAASIVHVSLA